MLIWVIVGIVLFITLFISQIMRFLVINKNTNPILFFIIVPLITIIPISIYISIIPVLYLLELIKLTRIEFGVIQAILIIIFYFSFIVLGEIKIKKQQSKSKDDNPFNL